MDLLASRPVHTLTDLRTRRTLQLVTFAIAATLVVAGLAGPQSAPRNLATVVTWIYFRGLLIVALLAAGNLFCAVCPMMLVRDVGRRLVLPTRRWPRALRNKWMAVALLVAGLFAYEHFSLWNLPRATALIIVGYFAVALLVDLRYTGASFCKFVCPIGQFNFITAMLSPFELRVRTPETCRTCRTADCIKGTPPVARALPVAMGRLKPAPTSGATAPTSGARGCELALFLPAKVGNLDCTLCFDCVRACPHDNIALQSRTPAAELAVPARRSGIGRIAARRDIAALAVVFTFGALVNAFAMTGTAAHLQHLLMQRMHLPTGETLAALFASGLLIAPIVLLAVAATITRTITADRHSRRSIAFRYVYALVPLGAAVWLAHFGFHLLSGILTIVPVTQSAVLDALGQAWMGQPAWSWTGIRPGLLFPAEIGCIVLGACGSAAAAYAIAQHEPRRPALASLPWQALIAMLALAAVWTLLQPMDMRGMVMPG
jgi:polyferredoxin